MNTADSPRETPEAASAEKTASNNLNSLNSHRKKMAHTYRENW